MNQSITEYRTVKGFPTYMVGKDGTFWSFVAGDGTPKRGPRWKQIYPVQITKYGHSVVTLFPGPVKVISSRLVLEVFVGPCPEGMEACHNNGNAKDNRLDNLRWDTRLENARDRVRHGTTGRKLTPEALAHIAEQITLGESVKALAESMGLNKTTVYRAIRRLSVSPPDFATPTKDGSHGLHCPAGV